jgi:hypothetical protein
VLAARFPQPDLPTFIASLGAAGAAPATRPSPQVVLGQAPAMPDTVVEVCTPPVHSSAPARIDDPVISVVTPLAPERFGWQLTVGQETQDLLREVQDLLGHEVAPGDLEARQKLLQRKVAEAERPLRQGRRSDRGRDPATVPGAQSVRGRAHIRRRVHAPQARGGPEPVNAKAESAYRGMMSGLPSAARGPGAAVPFDSSPSSTVGYSAGSSRRPSTNNGTSSGSWSSASGPGATRRIS